MTPDEALKDRGWETTRNFGELRCHSCVIGGVLCRWWGDIEPRGAKQLTDFALALTEQARESRSDERSDVLAYLEQLADSHPHAANLYRHAIHQLTSALHEGRAKLRAHFAAQGGT